MDYKRKRKEVKHISHSQCQALIPYARESRRVLHDPANLVRKKTVNESYQQQLTRVVSGTRKGLGKKIRPKVILLLKV